MARAQLREHAAGAQHALEQELDAAAAWASPAREARGQHAGVVEDEQVAGAQQLGQVGETAVLDRARRAVEHEQPARAALRERRLRDQLARQFVVEFASQHGAKFYATRRTRARRRRLSPRK